jgi:DNA-binding Lrp family transcriptional regulator
MDAMDEQILSLLKKDARESYVTIAKKLKTSEGTIRARVKKMVEQGEITGFTVRTRGKNVKALISIKIDINTDAASVAEKIVKIDGVEYVHEISGETDLIVLVDVLSTEDLNAVIDKIRSFGIQATMTMLILKEHYHE